MFVIDYFYWHYGVAPLAILGLLRNYFIGTWHRFLMGTHFRTLLSPWHRSRPSDATGKTRSPGEKIVNLIVDFYIRILAAIVRLTIILTGLIAEAIVAVAFAGLFFIWLLWPAVFIFLIIGGVSMITGF